jgi:transcriptional regulator with GAF, ATPase, and Fis domain/tetratricopeptide (TPR) repeat protein
MLPSGALVHRRYRLLRLLGEGATASTFLARDLVFDVDVALKLVAVEAALRGVLLDEFRTLRGLSHPCLGRVHDFGAGRLPDGTPYAFYSADPIDGATLDRHAEGRAFAAILPAFGDALRGLAFLHASGIRHGDFKPENVVVDAQGRGVLIDLGCARPLDGLASDTVSGTPRYLAPELLRGAAPDARADLYAVGVTLRDLLARCPGAPPSVARLAERLTRARPSARPGDAREVLEALELAPDPEPPPRPLRASSAPDDDVAVSARAAVEALLRGREGARVLVVVGGDAGARAARLRAIAQHVEPQIELVEGSAFGVEPVAGMLRRARQGTASEGERIEGVGALLGALDRLRAELRERGATVAFALEDADALPARERDLWLALVRSVTRDDPLLVLASEASAPTGCDALEALELSTPLAAPEVEALPDARGRRRVHAALATLDAPARDALLPLALACRVDGRLPRALLRPLGLDERALLALVGRRLATLDAAGFRLDRALAPAAVLRDAPPAQIAAWHSKLADAIEHAQPPLVDAEVRAPRTEAARQSSLVRHSIAAGELSRARERLRAEAARVDDFPDLFAAAALELSTASSDPDDLRLAARVLASCGRYADALRAFAWVLRRRPGEEIRREVRLGAASAYLGAGDARRALSTLAPLPSADPRAADLRSRAQVRLGAFARALQLAQDALPLVSAGDRGDAGDPRLAADLHDDLGVAASYLGEVATARRSLDEAARLHAREGRPRDEARSLSYRALADFRAGDAPAAARGFRRALAVAEGAAAAELVANAALNLGTASHQIGDLGDALRSYRRALALAIALGRASTAASLRANLAKLYVDVGAADRAEQAAEQAFAAARAIGAEVLIGALHATVGEIALLRGDVGSARSAFEAARDRFVAIGAARELAEVELQLADAALVASDVARAEAACARAAQASAQVDADDVRARRMTVEGRLAIARGELADGVERLEGAALLARRAGQRLLEAEIEARLADAHAAHGATLLARRHQTSACELFEQSAATLDATLEIGLVEAFFAHPLRRGRREALLPPAVVERSGREAKLARLVAINRKLSATLDPAQVLSLTIESALELTGAERGFVLVRPETTETEPAAPLEIACARNMEPQRDGEEGRFSRSVAERVVGTGEPVVTVDAESDGRFAAHRSVHAMRLKSVICAPIRAVDGILGALYLDHRFQRGLFGHEDVELLLAFADQVAIALTNARLHRELSRRTEELLGERRRIEALLRGQSEQIESLEAAVRDKQEALEHRFDYAEIAGRGPAMQAILRVLDRVVETPATVVVEGESGTGKELIARAIHFNGPRKQGPFVAINCGALPEALLESELFGYVRGAFTGALRDREGLFVRARGGTLFLDELGEMPLGMQVKLLRVLQERELTPLGSNATIPVDVRIVAATNRTLRDEVARGRFREDLYYRLGVVEIRLPPLRERLEDLPAIAARLLERAARSLGREPPRLTPAALRALLAHPWPGNVRELENALTKALVMTDRDRLEARDLELAVRPASSAPRDAPPIERRADWDAAEKQRILAALAAHGWNASRACRALGIPRASFYRKLARYEIDRAR